MGAAYELIRNGDMFVNRQRRPLAGRMSVNDKDASIHVFALNWTWKY